MLKKIIAIAAALAITHGTDVSAQLSETPAVCTSVREVNGSEIWKGCAASGHLSQDPRGKGVAFILRKGSRTRPSNCIKIYGTPTEAEPEGEQIGAMYMYPFNDPRAYAGRAYSNYIRGCGRGDTIKKLRNRSNGDPIFLKLKTNGGACVKVEKSYSNINSSQNCPRN